MLKNIEQIYAITMNNQYLLNVKRVVILQILEELNPIDCYNCLLIEFYQSDACS
jgi:hypothetical protein